METHSNIEKTLRQPRIIKNIALLIARRFIPIWFMAFIVLDLIFDSSFIVWTLSILSFSLIELFLLHSWYFSYVLPTHQRKLKNSLDLYNQCLADTTGAYLQDFIETIIDDSAWSIVHFGYMRYPTTVWRKIFRVIFNLVVKPCGVTSFELLPEPTSTGPIVRDLKTPYEITSPLTDQQQIEEKLQIVLSSLKIKENYFLKLLSIAQGYLNLSADYQNNAFAYDTYLRELLAIYAKNLGIAPQEIFDYRWEVLTRRRTLA